MTGWGRTVARNSQCIAIVAKQPPAAALYRFPEREDMKTNSVKYPGAPEVALWSGLAVGLGIVVHDVFFLIAVMIALIIPFGWLINWVREADERSASTRRHA